MTGPLEQPVFFDCEGERLLGVLHPAASQSGSPGVVIIVGGPQYRVGSHRQFVQLARGLAACGFQTFRFDCRGMGDSSGTFPGFQGISPDIRCAIDTLFRESTDLSGVVLFGLCDAASAALLYDRSDARVRGLILANPWVRTASGEAKSYVQHYYGRRLLQAGFWRKLLGGNLNVAAALMDFVRKIRSMRVKGRVGAETFIDRMLLGLESSRFPNLLLLSEHDLTAQEFRDLCSASPRWRGATGQACVTTQNFEADHTFSSGAAREQVLLASVSWLRGLGPLTGVSEQARSIPADLGESGNLR